MKIEWASDFHRDGSRRRRPIASTMHGWLAKMRGTLSGNESLRSQGMREMKEAKQNRDRRNAQKSGGVFSFFGSRRKPKRKSSGASRSSTRPSLRQHSSGSHRLVGQSSRSGQSRRSSGPSRRGTGTSQRRGTTRRSSGR
ncbi:hypothetical protein BDP27DRAFT_1209865 [Rhodocollybia butyracea]|uniref:Uncharacterized protein n=1 Tax=Rhodocollybia butyracea TaxID=206335 RepID=A0A9P5Q9P9_9AGAR|nr:hypothetical protein BDP27DRAFT_1209865 [Rhodocollybia butyracea]